MALIIFVFLPAAWALTGYLLGRAVAVSVPSERSTRLGDALSRWGGWFLPLLYLLVFHVGGSGDAAHGARLFGSEEWFAPLCFPWYAVPTLAVYLGAACVLRDLVRGLRARRS
jgi:hypothetical protein